MTGVGFGARRRAGPLIAGLGLSAAALLAPPAARAADEPFTLPGPTVQVLIAEVTGDTAREVIRLTTPAEGEYLEIEIWAAARAGGWTRLATGQTPALATSFSEDAAALIAWSLGGREQVLLLSGASTPPAGILDLGIQRVGLDGDRLTLERLEGGEGAAEQVIALDVDADETDELLIIEPLDPNVPERHARLMRWGDGRFTDEAVLLGEGLEGIYPSAVGETDGRPGEEAILTEDGEELLRVAIGETGSLQLERASALAGPDRFRWLLGVADGTLVMQESRGVLLARWPPGGRLTIDRRVERGVEFPFAVLLGEGPNAVIVDHSSLDFNGGGLPDATVFDLRYEPQGTITPSAAAARLWELASTEFQAVQGRTGLGAPYPAMGPIPGGIDDETHAYLAAGNLVTWTDGGGVDIRPASALAGVVPMGVAGPDPGWLATGNGYFAFGRDIAFLSPLYSDPEASLTLTPMAQALSPEADEGRLAPELSGAATVTTPDGERLAIGDEGFTATIAGPPGSRLVAAMGSGIVTDEVIGLDGSVVVEFGAPGRGRRNSTFDAAIALLTPSGQAYTRSWRGDVLRELPELSARAETAAFTLSATVSGEASPGAIVTVNGTPASPAADGTFSVEVDAPIWPQEILVVARDPVGNETAEQLQVVGFLDYRGLPWLGIVVAATLAFGAVLFVRIPQRRPAPAAVLNDGEVPEEIMLEELTLDDIEAVESIEPSRR